MFLCAAQPQDITPVATQATSSPNTTCQDSDCQGKDMQPVTLSQGIPVYIIVIYILTSTCICHYRHASLPCLCSLQAGLLQTSRFVKR